MSLLITLGLGSDIGGGISPYMGLDIPIVSATPGPLYAEDVNQSLFTIDAHDHTFGNGKAVPVPGGVVVTANWNFGGFDIFDLQSTCYLFQSVVLPGTVVGAVYFKGVDLYVNDGNGIPIQITEGGTVNVTAGKGFSGDFGMPGVPATVPYTAASHVFDFYEDPAGPTWAILGVGAIRFHGGAGTGSQYIALEAPALAGTFTWTLPTLQAAAAGPEAILIDSTGAMSYAGLPVAMGTLPKFLLQTATGVVSWGPTSDPLAGHISAIVQDGTSGAVTAAELTTAGGIVVSAGALVIPQEGVVEGMLKRITPGTNTGAGAISFVCNNTGTYNAITNSPSLAVPFDASVGFGSVRPVYFHLDLVQFADTGGGGSTLELFIKLFDGTTTSYVALFQDTSNGNTELLDTNPTVIYTVGPFLLANTGYTATLVWNASVQDGATFSTSGAVTLKAFCA